MICLTEKDEERFWSKVDKSKKNNETEKTKDCWLWTAGLTTINARSPEGYGSIGVGGTALRANRVSYYLYDRSFDQSLNVLHTCDNTLCVNPDHLFLGTHADNARDKVSKCRQASKLTEDQVREIRLLSGVCSQTELAEQFNISSVSVSNIVNYKTWKHI